MSYYYTQVFERFRPQLLQLSGATNELQADFTKTRLLLCGESHGVRENADVAYTVCKRLGVRRLAIERSASNFEPFVQSAIVGNQNFMLPQALLSLQASVLSLEMLKAIVVLVQEGAIEEVVYVYIDTANNPQLKDIADEDYMRVREQEIARNIAHLKDDAPTMVLLGNYHTRLEADDMTGESALQMVRLVKPATYLKYEYLSGVQYNAGRLMHFLDKRSATAHDGPAYKVEATGASTFNITTPKASRILV